MYRFMPRLPRHGQFYASLMDDEETVTKLSGVTGPKTFGFDGWTYERELLTTVVDVLCQMHASFIQVHSEDHKRPNSEPLPRPKTALDRVRAKQVIREHENLVALLRPPVQR